MVFPVTVPHTGPVLCFRHSGPQFEFSRKIVIEPEAHVHHHETAPRTCTVCISAFLPNMARGIAARHLDFESKK